MKRAAVLADPHGSEWRAARLLGGTLAAVCRKAGSASAPQPLENFEDFLRCPNCHSTLNRNPADSLICAHCGYEAANEDGVYNLLPSAERAQLYPGDREDIVDFSQPGHTRHLVDGWYDLEGVFGNKYRWIGARATAILKSVDAGPQTLRIRCHASSQGVPGEVRALVNGRACGQWKIDRTGLFILEAAVDPAAEYLVEIQASPVWEVPTDDRKFTVNISGIRLT